MIFLSWFCSLELAFTIYRQKPAEIPVKNPTYCSFHQKVSRKDRNSQMYSSFSIQPKWLEISVPFVSLSATSWQTQYTTTNFFLISTFYVVVYQLQSNDLLPGGNKFEWDYCIRMWKQSTNISSEHILDKKWWGIKHNLSWLQPISFSTVVVSPYASVLYFTLFGLCVCFVLFGDTLRPVHSMWLPVISLCCALTLSHSFSKQLVMCQGTHLL